MVRALWHRLTASREVAAPENLSEILRQHGTFEGFDPCRHFFGNVLAKIRTLDAAGRFADANYNGQWSASNIENCIAIHDFLFKHDLIKAGQSACDIGASRARLTSFLLKDGCDAYAIDGTDYGMKRNMLDIPRERYAVYDFRINIDMPAMRKMFRLTTSFEVLEHVPSEHVPAFVRNVAFVSDIFLASIHTGGNEAENHYTVRSTDWWEEQFKPYGGVEWVTIPPLDKKWNDSNFILARFDPAKTPKV